MARKLTGSVVVATHNPGKLKEIRELLAPYGLATQSASDLDLPEPKETGKTFAANARIKALAAARASGKPAFADDSGLVVDALGGEPGINSARWAGPDRDFRAAMNRIQTLLIERGAKALDQRRAHFVAALCLAWPDGHVEEFEGRIDGVAVWPPRGDKGFGYDPLFRPNGFDHT
ncbi:MAG TPA: non-canonical purine NTP pyrophosphatase, partial [Pseudolabrys sp.]